MTKAIKKRSSLSLCCELLVLLPYGEVREAHQVVLEETDLKRRYAALAHLSRYRDRNGINEFIDKEIQLNSIELQLSNKMDFFNMPDLLWTNFRKMSLEAVCKCFVKAIFRLAKNGDEIGIYGMIIEFESMLDDAISELTSQSA